LDKDGLRLPILCTSKKLSKALFYVNKALTIDDQNQLYWKRYATINKQLDLFEEAEFGFRKAVEFGDHETLGCFGLIFFNS
jgi:Tfp pilus assembly protein PilF